jgi:hypothetical protein
VGKGSPKVSICRWPRVRLCPCGGLHEIAEAISWVAPVRPALSRGQGGNHRRANNAYTSTALPTLQLLVL